MAGSLAAFADDQLGPGDDPPATNSAPERPSDDARAPARKKTRSVLYLPSSQAEILRLTKAGVGEDIIIAYIKRQPFVYPAVPSQIIALRDVGVSPRVLKEMVEHQPTHSLYAGVPRGYPPGGPLTSPAASMGWSPAYGALASAGGWGYAPGYGYYWQPGFGSAAGWPFLPDNLSISASGGSGDSFVSSDDDHHGHGWHHRGDWNSWGMNGSDNSLSALGQVHYSHIRRFPVGTLPGSGGPVYGVPGVPVAAQNSGSPWLPVGGTPASGNASPWIPVGGVPASGSLPPWGTFGVTPVANTGGNPWLPVGMQPGSGTAPPFGVFGGNPGFVGGAPGGMASPGFQYTPSWLQTAPSTPSWLLSPAELASTPGPPLLPPSPILRAPPTLPGGPFLPGWPRVQYSQYAGWPSAAPWPSVPAQVPFGGYGHAGVRGGFGGAPHGVYGGGGVARGGGGGAALGGAASGRGGGGGGGHK